MGKGDKKRGKINFEKVYSRFIALRIAYDGRLYRGNAHQKHEECTVEGELLRALERLQLAPSIDFCHLSRAGRTDAGVSAAANVVVLRVRSKKTDGPGVLAPGWTRNDAENTDSKQDEEGEEVEEKSSPLTLDRNEGLCASCGGEMDYVLLLNRVLPISIRVSGWTPVLPDFSARFGCRGRCYRYLFVKRDLDLGVMKEAAQRFRGVHDFRNFCKIDATSVKTWVREVRHFTVVLVQKGEDMGEDIWAFEIRGSAFLRSQVRMMVKVLFLIGKGLEKPEVITELLDVEKYKQRPAYTLAPAEPLVLYSCQFPSLQFLLSGSATGDAEGWTNPLDEPSSTPHQEGDIGVMSIAVKNLAADELLSGVEEEWEKRALDFALFKTISR